MKLYVAPGACSMSSHIAFEESRLPFEAVVCPWGDKARWEEIDGLNPQGAVPVLVLDDGKVLTQNIAILTYVADRAPAARLLPPAGSFELAQTYQWLSWTAADLHRAFGPLFDEAAPEAAREKAVARVDELLAQADRHLDGKDLLVGSFFTIADAYLFTVFSWTRAVNVPTDHFRNLGGYSDRIAERRTVRAVMKREGLRP